MVAVTPNTDLAAAVANHPEGTVFQFSEGTHRVGPIEPKNDQTFQGSPGSILSGEDVEQYAFTGPATGVTVAGFIIERYATPLQHGAIEPLGSDWLIRDNEIRHNAAAAVGLVKGTEVRRNYIHHNSQIGLLAHQATGAVISSNEIAYNNPTLQYDMAWEAGGVKIMDSTDVLVVDNVVHHNGGVGLWTDHDNDRIVYERNHVYDNEGPGILHEISFGASIRDNIISGNAFGFYTGGILISASQGVTVHGNELEDNDGGVIGLQAERGGYILDDLKVYENVIRYDEGVTGVLDQIGDGSVFQRSIEFRGNEFTVPPGSKAFAWDGQLLKLDRWLAKH